MNPLRPLLSPLAAIPGLIRTVAALPDVVEAVLVLPALSQQLEEVRFATAALPEMLAEIRLLHEDTASLPAIREEMARVAASVAVVEKNTLAVEQLAELAVPLQAAALRVGRLTDRLPRRPVARPGEPQA